MVQGINIKPSTSGHNLEIGCTHSQGLLYIIPSEGNWVCSKDTIHAHSIAGFFNDLSNLNDPKVKELTQKWGIYYRTTKNPLTETISN